jgi:mRNA interferase MazF
MVVERGEIWWADLRAPAGSEPGYRRPVLVIQSDAANQSSIRTIIALVLTTNLRLLDAPGNVLIPSKLSGLHSDSVANVSQVFTVDRSFLTEQVGKIRGELLRKVESGLRLILEL